MLNKLKRKKLRKGLERKIGQRPVIVTFNIQGLMDMVILGFNKGFPLKFHPMIQLLITKKYRVSNPKTHRVNNGINGSLVPL